MPTKKGNKLHSKGNMLPFSEGASCTQFVYAAALAAVLRAEVEHQGIGAKAIMKWTGASERAVKGWLSGERGPSGEHLISLMANSSAVTAAVMLLAACRSGQFACNFCTYHRLACLNSHAFEPRYLKH